LIEDNYAFNDIFEQKVAKYAGAKYGVAVDSCSHAIFLCLEYLRRKKELSGPHSRYENIKLDKRVHIPNRTYVSVPMQIIHAGFEPVLVKSWRWYGQYSLYPLPILDSAAMFCEGMYPSGCHMLQCISFQEKKMLSLGKGGMILTDDWVAYEELKRISFDGRNRDVAMRDDTIPFIGFHMNMTPDQAAQGIIKFNALKSKLDGMSKGAVRNMFGGFKNYIPLDDMSIFSDTKTIDFNDLPNAVAHAACSGVCGYGFLD
jgi:dTDP-4-amino-4,6-dideoxygalactose transaminase